MDLALPLVGVFGLGVFMTLAGVAVLVTYCKLRVTAQYAHLAQYAQIVSSALLLILALILASQVL
jgi:hypothetical protein